MKYSDATIVVTLAVRDILKEMVRRLDKGDCAGMFIQELSPTGVGPATHFFSSGAVPKVVYGALKSDTTLYSKSKKAWEDDGDIYPYTQLQVTNNLALCDVTDMTKVIVINGVNTKVSEHWTEVLARMGLKVVSSAI